MTPEKRKEIAGIGGKKAHALGRAHTWDTNEAIMAGRKRGKNKSKNKSKKKLCHS